MLRVLTVNKWLYVFLNNWKYTDGEGQFSYKEIDCLWCGSGWGKLWCFIACCLGLGWSAAVRWSKISAIISDLVYSVNVTLISLSWGVESIWAGNGYKCVLNVVQWCVAGGCSCGFWMSGSEVTGSLQLKVCKGRWFSRAAVKRTNDLLVFPFPLFWPQRDHTSCWNIARNPGSLHMSHLHNSD